MQTDSKFTPTHWIILAVLVCSFAMVGLGAWMLYAGIAAEGAVDIKTTIASGTIKTGSAGLFIIFFAFLVIIAALALLISSAGKDRSFSEVRGTGPRSKRLLPALYAVLVGTILSALGVALFPEGARLSFMTASFILGTAMFALVTAYIRAVAEDEA